jgi:hypothetical protein
VAKDDLLDELREGRQLEGVGQQPESDQIRPIVDTESPISQRAMTAIGAWRYVGSAEAATTTSSPLSARSTAAH